MPIVKVDWTARKTKEEKKAFMDFVAETICANTGTAPKNIYVYINEWDEENVRKTAPIVLIDWTDMPETRTVAAKKTIMVALTDKLAEITGENKNDIVIIFTDIPLTNAAIGGVTRFEDKDF